MEIEINPAFIASAAVPVNSADKSPTINQNDNIFIDALPDNVELVYVIISHAKDYYFLSIQDKNTNEFLDCEKIMFTDLGSYYENRLDGQKREKEYLDLLKMHGVL